MSCLFLCAGIVEFIESCDAAITRFNTIVNHVQKNSEQIRKAVNSIRDGRLVNVHDFDARTAPMSMEELHERLERHRVAEVDRLVKKYRSIGPLLIIIEQYVCDSERGDAPGTPCCTAPCLLVVLFHADSLCCLQECANTTRTGSVASSSR
jgi:hypothetical protein